MLVMSPVLLHLLEDSGLGALTASTLLGKHGQGAKRETEGFDGVVLVRGLMLVDSWALKPSTARSSDIENMYRYAARQCIWST